MKQEEEARLEALYRYDVLDTEPEAAFDEIARLAAGICAAPMAAISLVDYHRTWFKSNIGLPARQVPRGIGFCSRVVAQKSPLSIPDTLEDSKFSHDPLVIGEPYIRFYAGVPLLSPAGLAMGALCVLDRSPRHLTAEQFAALMILARQTVTVLELRRALADRNQTALLLKQREVEFETIFHHQPGFIQLVARDGTILRINPAGLEILEADCEARAAGAGFLEFIAPEYRPAMTGSLKAVFRGEHVQSVYEAQTCKGTRRWMESHAAPLSDSKGKVLAMLAINRDITDRRSAEEAQRRIQLQLTNQQNALIALTRLEALRRGDLAEAVQKLTEISARTLNLERVSVWRYTRDRTGIRCLDLYELSQNRHSAGAELAAADYPTYFRALDSSDVINADDARVDPRTSEFREHYLVPLGITSMLDTPIRVAGAVEGVVCHEHTGAPRRWSLDEQTFAVALGNLASLAIEASERRMAEENLRGSEERFRQIAENIREVFWLWDPLRCVLEYVSPAYEEVWGASRAELDLSPEAWMKKVHPDDAQRVLDAWKIGAPHGQFAEEYRIVRSDGTIRWIRDRAFPVRNREGALQRVAGIAEDVTDLKAARGTLNDSFRRYESLVSSIDGVVWEARIDPLQFLFVGESVERVFGHPARRWLENPGLWESLIHPDDRARTVETCLAESRAGRNHVLEYRMTAADGRVVWVRDHVSISRQPDGSTRLLGIMIDFTRYRDLEDQLRQSQKMEAVGQLAGGVAHDFNNLLAAILGFGELALSQTSDSDPRKEYLQEIYQAGSRAASLTRQLLAFSRRQVVQQNVEDLNAVLLDLEKMLRRLIREDIDLTLVRDPGPCWVRVGTGYLEQVIVNLVVNARDAMPRGGRLDVRTRVLLPDDPLVLPRLDLPSGHRVLLEVEDTGEGMSEETLNRLFEPYFTTKETGKGTGLGLSTVYGIVKQCAGAIWAESELGRRTCFRVLLPLVDVPGSSPAQAPPGEAGLSRGETILLVEDSDTVRKVVAKFLRRSGYRVLDVADPISALEVVGGHAGSIQLLVTDVVMPAMNGRELSELISAKRRIRTLFMSGYMDDTVLRHGVEDSTCAFLHKPFTEEALTTAVRKLLDEPSPGAGDAHEKGSSDESADCEA